MYGFWCLIYCLYHVVPDILLCISMIDSGNKYTTCFSSVVMIKFKIVKRSVENNSVGHL